MSAPSPIETLHAVARAEDCARWLAAIDKNAQSLSEYASSIRVRSIPEISINQIPGRQLLRHCEEAFGGPVVCDVDECWVRRQYAPRNYPRRHAPHSWHQDGALRFDFNGRFREDQQEGVLEMITCWLALTPCGVDAPGLELMTASPEVLIAPANLTAERIRERFSSAEFVCPQMQPGEALLFSGDVLHRTHVHSSMSKNRTSIELRFFPADRIPERLKGDQFVGFPTR